MSANNGTKKELCNATPDVLILFAIIMKTRHNHYSRDGRTTGHLMMDLGQLIGGLLHMGPKEQQLGALHEVTEQIKDAYEHFDHASLAGAHLVVLGDLADMPEVE